MSISINPQIGLEERQRIYCDRCEVLLADFEDKKGGKIMYFCKECVE